jgi:hypothetical protein
VVTIAVVAHLSVFEMPLERIGTWERDDSMMLVDDRMYQSLTMEMVIGMMWVVPGRESSSSSYRH